VNLSPDEVISSHTFGTDGTFCSLECCLAHVMIFKHFDTLYKDSEDYIFTLHYLMYPGDPLTPAQDYKLLAANGGSLTEEEFWSNKHFYKRTTNIILAPVKIQHRKVLR
jgi:hypothetical protein